MDQFNVDHLKMEILEFGFFMFGCPVFSSRLVQWNGYIKHLEQSTLAEALRQSLLNNEGDDHELKKERVNEYCKK